LIRRRLKGGWKVRHFFSFALLFGALAVLVVSGCSGDSKKPSDKKDSGDGTKGPEAVVLGAS
jgi:hypothetical protein